MSARTPNVSALHANALKEANVAKPVNVVRRKETQLLVHAVVYVKSLKENVYALTASVKSVNAERLPHARLRNALALNASVKTANAARLHARLRNALVLIVNVKLELNAAKMELVERPVDVSAPLKENAAKLSLLKFILNYY